MTKNHNCWTSQHGQKWGEWFDVLDHNFLMEYNLRPPALVKLIINLAGGGILEVLITKVEELHNDTP